MPGRAGRAHRRDHLPEQLVGQLRLIPVTSQARRLRRPDIPRGGLHVHARPPGRRALPRPGQPRPQDLSHLCHQNLPERHPLPSLPVRNEPEDHSRVVHQLANQVVPSPWQQLSAGGPMLMADDNGGQRPGRRSGPWNRSLCRSAPVLSRYPGTRTARLTGACRASRVGPVLRRSAPAGRRAGLCSHLWPGQATDSERVAALYVVLGYPTPSPVVELNGAVAVGMAYGPARGLEIGDRLVGPSAPPPAWPAWWPRADRSGRSLGRRPEARR